MIEEIARLKEKFKITIAAHYYQKDEIVNIADFVGDSLELSKKSAAIDNEFLIFCGVGFMAQSVKIIAPKKRVFMPKIACCSMAKMIDKESFDRSIGAIMARGIKEKEILPVAYINSNADVKSAVGKMGGVICTSANAEKIMKKAVESGKKIFFLPDRCLGINISDRIGLKSAVLGADPIDNADVICFDGFCSVHQLFTPEDVKFYRSKYPDIVIAVHPECDPRVIKLADFVGSTSQIISFVRNLPTERKVAVGTEFNLVNRLRDKNTFVLSSVKPQCPTMSETTISDLLNVMKSIESGEYINEILVDLEEAKWAKTALDRMLEIS